jgi:hypothetical protein
MDEFDGQGSLERAQEGLQDISDMLALTSEAFVARVF